MGKVDHLRKRVEPFAVLYWALGIVLANTRPYPPSHPTAVHKACPFMVIVGSILNKDAWAPPHFLYLGIYFLSMVEVESIFTGNLLIQQIDLAPE